MFYRHVLLPIIRLIGFLLTISSVGVAIFSYVSKANRILVTHHMEKFVAILYDGNLLHLMSGMLVPVVIGVAFTAGIALILLGRDPVNSMYDW